MFIKHNRVRGNSISIAKGDNIAYATYEPSISAVKDGSFLRFESENCFYVIQCKESTEFLHDFEVIGDSSVIVKEDLSGKIHCSDIVDLVFREYELDIVVAIVNAGSGYAVGDVLTVRGGKPSLNVSDGLYNAIQIVLNGVKDGGVSRIGVKNRGKYIEPPLSEVELEGGKGKDAKFELAYKPLNAVTKVKRTVRGIEIKNSETIIQLDSLIPPFITMGKLIYNKWLFYLATPYLSDTKVGVGFSVSRDFTPNLNIPLMASDSFTTDVVYNKAIHMLEDEILKLNKRIDHLNNELTILKSIK